MNRPWFSGDSSSVNPNVSERRKSGGRLCYYRFLSGLSGFTGVIAHFSSGQRQSLFRLFQEMFHHWDNSILFRKQNEVAGIRDHGEFGVGDSLKGLDGVFNADKIVISDDNENRGFY